MFQRWKNFIPVALLLAIILSGTALISSASNPVQNNTQKERFTRPLVTEYFYSVLNSWNHDTNAFTQGLIFHDGFLYESTGLTGQSSLRKVDLDTGQVLMKIDVPRPHFAEGMTIFNNKIYQLTWLSHVGFIYDLQTFNKEGEFKYSSEGWGLTHDDKFLIMSDGTSTIRFLDAADFSVKRSINVTINNRPVFNLNELEYINGEIFANIWQTDKIVRINPENGNVIGLIDLTGLLPPEMKTAHVDVLNGIAFDKSSGRLFVTGKLWPRIFEIKLTNKLLDRDYKDR